MLLLKNELWPPLASLEREISDFPSQMQRYLVEFLFDSNGNRDIKGLDNLDDYIENPRQFVKRFKDAKYNAFYAPDNQGQVKIDNLKDSARKGLVALGELSIFDALESAGLTDEDRKNLGMGNYQDAKEAIISSKGDKEYEPTKEEIEAIIEEDNQKLKDIKMRQVLDETSYRDLFIGYYLSEERMKVPDESEREFDEETGEPKKFFEELNNLRKDVMEGKFVMDEDDIKDAIETRNIRDGKSVSGIRFTLNMTDETGSPTKAMKDKLVELGFRLSDWEIEKVPPSKTKKIPDSLYGAGKIKELMNAIQSEAKEFSLLAPEDNKVIQAMEGQVKQMKEEFTINVGSKNRLLFLDVNELENKLNKVEQTKTGNPFTWVGEANSQIEDMANALLAYYTDRAEYIDEDQKGALFLFRTQYGNEELTLDDYTKFYEAKGEWAREIASQKITVLNDNILQLPLASKQTFGDKEDGMFIEEEELVTILSQKKMSAKFRKKLGSMVSMMAQLEYEVLLIQNQQNLNIEDDKVKEITEGMKVRTYSEGLPVISNKGKVKDAGKIIQLSNKIVSSRKELEALVRVSKDMDKLAEKYSTSKQLKDLFAMMGATMGQYSKQLGVKGKMLTTEDAKNAIEEIKNRQSKKTDKTKQFTKLLIDGEGGKDGVLLRLMKKSPFVNLQVFGKSRYDVRFTPVENEPEKMEVDIQVWHSPKGKLRVRYTKQTTYDFIPSGSSPRTQLEQGTKGKVGINPFRRRWLMYVKERERMIKNAIGM